jgi:hypothetical protein
MIVQCDDDLYRVDRVFLGPKGKPWPFRLTYRGWVVCATLAIVIVIVWRMIHLPWHPVMLIGAVVVAFLGAQWLDVHLTVDRPPLAEIERLGQELAAPRPDLNPKPVAISGSIEVPRWKAGAVPDVRWYARLLPGLTHALSRASSSITGHKKGRIYVDGGWQDVK